MDTDLAALCFNLSTQPEVQEANAEYAQKLRDLARRLGLPRPRLIGSRNVGLVVATSFAT
jgi:hypothetical protein